MSDHEPPHRKQRHPLPEADTAIALARIYRQAWVDAMRATSHSAWTEDEIAAREDDSQLGVDITEEQE